MFRALLLFSMLLLPKSAFSLDYCESALNSPLFRSLQNFTYVSFPLTGFKMVLPSAAGASTHTLDLSSYPSSVDLKTTLWSHEQKYFLFLDTGFKNLEIESDIIEQAVAYHLLFRPDQNLEVILGEDRIRARQILHKYRWALHFAVLDVYKEKKKYLTPEDLYHLQASAMFSSNSDVFAVLEAEGKVFSSYDTRGKIADRLLLTLQISYPGERNFFKPTVKGLQVNSGGKPIIDDDRLPFEYRLNPIQEFDFRDKFYTRFPKSSTCEFTRYAKLKKLPRSTHDRFLLEALHTAVRRGMKVIIASGDRHTARLFGKYGFKIYGELPTRQRETKEFLTYLELNSPEFKQVVWDLESSGTATQILDEDFFE